MPNRHSGSSEIRPRLPHGQINDEAGDEPCRSKRSRTWNSCRSTKQDDRGCWTKWSAINTVGRSNLWKSIFTCIQRAEIRMQLAAFRGKYSIIWSAIGTYPTRMPAWLCIRWKKCQIATFAKTESSTIQAFYASMHYMKRYGRVKIKWSDQLDR